MMGSPEPPRHTQDCQDYALIHHASTGGDAECICGAGSSVPPDGTRLIREFIENNGYEVVTMSDGERSVVPMDTAPVLAALAAVEERVNELEQRATLAESRANQLEASIKTILKEDAVVVTRQRERIEALEKAFDLLGSAYAHMLGDQKAKAARLRAAAYEALSPAGEDAK